MRIAFMYVALVAALTSLNAQDFGWPTPKPALPAGRPAEEYIQPTESGLVESGMFGCGRTGGRQFHEGVDLKPERRNARGEPVDAVVAVAAGIVRHVNAVPGLSNYGRYVVIEHKDLTPSVITLYAHLESVASGIRPGVRIESGATVGIMGHSASNGIPRDRAHLHLELGFVIGEGFQAWYDRQKFPSRNEHGLYNGMNILSLDFLDFMSQRKAGTVRDLRDYLEHLPTAAAVVVKTRAIPDFVRRYPDLLQAAPPASGVEGWRIEFSWFGLPKAWWPLDAREVGAVAGAGTTVVFHDPALLGRYPCQGVIRTRGGAPTPGSKMQDALDIIFTPAR